MAQSFSFTKVRGVYFILAAGLVMQGCISSYPDAATLSASGDYISGPTLTPETNASIIREAVGKFEYRRPKLGTITGEEEFTLTVQSDGTRTIQARNRTESIGMQRHVIHRVDKNLRPLETLAVYYMDGQWAGTGWFAVSGNKLRAIATSPDGIFEQELDVPDYVSFVPHPLSTNAFHGWNYDRDKGGVQIVTWYNIEGREQGDDSMLGKLSENELELIGQTELTTPAGTFQVDHWRTGSVNYYTTGPDMMMVMFDWPKYDFQYVLSELIVRK